MQPRPLARWAARPLRARVWRGFGWKLAFVAAVSVAPVVAIFGLLYAIAGSDAEPKSADLFDVLSTDALMYVGVSLEALALSVAYRTLTSTRTTRTSPERNTSGGVPSS